MDVAGSRGIFVFRAGRPARPAAAPAQCTHHLHVMRAASFVLGGGKLGIAVDHGIMPALAQERDDLAIKPRVVRIGNVVGVIVPRMAWLEAQIVEAMTERAGGEQYGAARCAPD